MTTHEVRLPLFDLGTHHPEMKRYRTLVADPPWRYSSRLSGLRGATDYPTMSIEELMCMPIGLWAEPEAHLYLWTTDAFMVDAHRIAHGWGFEVKNILTWVKGRAEIVEGGEIEAIDPRMGVGFYYRHATEYVLFAVRGALPVHEHGQPNVFFAPRMGHSVKPDAFYDMVERMSPGPYLDVFARKQRLGWKVFGNEAYNPDHLLDTLAPLERQGLIGGG